MRPEMTGAGAGLHRGRSRRNWAVRTNPLLGRALARPAPARRLSRFVGPTGLLLLGAVALLGLQAFLTPPAVIMSHVEQELEIFAVTSFRVYPRVGTLYESPAPLSERALYLSRVAEAVEVSFDFTLVCQPAATLEVQRGLALEFGAPGLWEKHRIVEPVTPVQVANGRVSLRYLLDPADIAAEIEAIARETGVAPEDGPYEVSLVASVEAALEDGRPLRGVISPAFRLRFRPDLLAFEPSFSPASQVIRTLESRERRPNHLSLLGLSVPVVPARLGGVAAAGVLGVWQLARRRPRTVSPPRLDRRLARRLVLARGLAGELSRWPRLYLDELDDLLRLAGERGRAVLAAAPDEPPLYCLLADGVAYVHVPDAGPPVHASA